LDPIEADYFLCQQLRCTGRSRDCSRCTERGQTCIFPAFRAGSNRRNCRNSNSNTPSLQGEDKPGTDASSNGRNSSPLDNGSLDDGGGAENGSGAKETVPTDTLDFYPGLDHFDPYVDMALFAAPGDGPNGPQPDQAHPAGPDMVGNFMHTMAASQPGVSVPAISQVYATHGLGRQALYAAHEASPQSTAAYSVTGSASSASSRGSCSCVENTVRIVQQLENDEFRLITMPMDGVMQLVRWVVSECRAAVQCRNCTALPTARTMVVIICDRVAEMFQCLHRRIRRVNERLSAQAMADMPLAGFWSALAPKDPNADDTTRPPSPDSAAPQLFCSITEADAGKAMCNPLLFADHVHGTYSDEEQVHMISSLLRLQMNNVNDLLNKLAGVALAAGSHAHAAKVKSMQARMTQSGADIDTAFGATLALFAASQEAGL
jgi:hypothetical protein